MFSPFARDLLRPERQTRVESLLKPPYLVLDDPWQDSFPSLSPFFKQGKAKNSLKAVGNFHLFMNVVQFKPCEINIETIDGSVVIEAKHEDNVTQHSAWQFKRCYKLPDDIDPSTVNSTFNENGLLVIKANKKASEPEQPDKVEDTFENKPQNVRLNT